MELAGMQTLCIPNPTIVANNNPCPTNVSATTTNRKLKNLPNNLTREDFDGGPVSLDEIQSGLYLGNLTAATHTETLKSYKITHILTLDSVPLPKHIVEAAFLKTKYVHIADMPKEDILHHLDACVSFIDDAIQSGGNILVHCYFGVSRSSAVIIAYVMKRQNMDYQDAFDFVKSKRRFVQPNAGFIAQLKLYQRMGCTIDLQNLKYKLYRLRLAGEQVRKAKILPQSFNNLIRPDPAVTQENPEPIVYRCRKCRRILASKSCILHNQEKNALKVQQLTTTERNLQQSEKMLPAATATRLLDQIAMQIKKVSLNSSPTGVDGNIEHMLFIEPIAWMKDILKNTQGRLNCPKCDQKLGNFSWINGCQCPCGEELSPAFYLIPSRVELSKAVQNVQTTL